ncbi:MAG: ATP-binding cassette domain-containing protein [Cyclobacteriaceae bacterium]|jgi:molybdate transport system ATP-binding protein|nr:ATP-binding cassette domain-containing protein [Cyclobacteriaceae bacterium]
MLTINYRDCSFSYKGKTVLENISFSIPIGQHCAILGSIGSGKTMLLKSLKGLLPLTRGEREFTYKNENLNPYEFSLLTELVEFAESNKYFRPKQHFYQQRYQSLEDDESRSLLVKNYLELQGIDMAVNSELLRKAKISELLDRKLIHISSGQRKRLQLAIAIAKKPNLLMLDFPYTGMDMATRLEINSWLEEVANLYNIQLIIVANESDLPSFIETRYTLENPRIIDEKQSQSALSKLKYYLNGKNNTDVFKNAIQMDRVNLSYAGYSILKSLNWIVKKGELVGLKGLNGSGKSSLLSLIYGDNPLAYNKEIYLFDKKRGTGESIWDIKRKIGFVSAEFHLYMSDSITCGKLIATGYFDQLFIPRKLVAEEEELIDLFLTYFGIQNLKNIYFDQCSIGEQRLILFVRALIKNPSLILLDEPYHCLDEATIKLANELLETIIDISCNTLVFISHDSCFMPKIIQKIQLLNDGQIVDE